MGRGHREGENYLNRVIYEMTKLKVQKTWSGVENWTPAWGIVGLYGVQV